MKYVSNFQKISKLIHLQRGCPRGVMVKVMDCEFELQSRNYVHFRTNTLGKGMNPLSSQLWVK